MKYVSSMKMHSKFILSKKFYINSINQNAHNLFCGFLLMNGGTFIHSLVMEFDDILRWNKFFEKISSMYSYVSSTQYNLLIVSFPPLNFIHVQWLNIHEISLFYGRNAMKTQVEVKTFENIVHNFFNHSDFMYDYDRETSGLICTIMLLWQNLWPTKATLTMDVHSWNLDKF
jgi:hypothetical protein